MANDITKFQEGQKAAMAGLPLDKRKQKDWQEGWDAARAAKNSIYPYYVRKGVIYEK